MKTLGMYFFAGLLIVGAAHVFTQSEAFSLCALALSALLLWAAQRIELDIVLSSSGVNVARRAKIERFLVGLLPIEFGAGSKYVRVAIDVEGRLRRMQVQHPTGWQEPTRQEKDFVVEAIKAGMSDVWDSPGIYGLSIVMELPEWAVSK